MENETNDDDCLPCHSTGYLLDQSYGYAEIPAGWTTVQACDACHPDLSDEDAARMAAAANDAIPAWFPPTGEYRFENGEDGDEHPGDWAINWKA